MPAGDEGAGGHDVSGEEGMAAEAAVKERAGRVFDSQDFLGIDCSLASSSSSNLRLSVRYSPAFFFRLSPFRSVLVYSIQ